MGLMGLFPYKFCGGKPKDLSDLPGPEGNDAVWKHR